MRKLELQVRHGSSTDVPVEAGARWQDSFDVTKIIPLVPVFWKNEIESYFGAFEHIAGALNWPKDVWAILL